MVWFSLEFPDGIGRLEYCIAFCIDQHIFIYLPNLHECKQYCLNALYDLLNTVVVGVQPSSLGGCEQILF